MSKNLVFQMHDRILHKPITKHMRVHFFDTAGQERYSAIATSHYRKAFGALVCYSVSDRESFEAVEAWIA